MIVDEKRCVKMITETKIEDGNPKDGETAGTESVLKDEKPCTRMHDIAVCISRKGYLCLLQGPCEPCDRDGNIQQREIAAIRKNQEAHGIIDADQMNLDLRRGKVLQTFRSGNLIIKEVAL